MQTIGTWDDTNKVNLCFDSLPVYNISNCYQPFYREYSGNDKYLYLSNSVPPSDKLPDKYAYMPKSASGAFIFFGCMIIVMTLFIFGFYFYYRDSKTLKNAQLRILCTINFACLLGGIRVLLTGWQ